MSLDVALMLLAREEWGATRCIRVGWTDASPLAGHDLVEVPVPRNPFL
jgi:hypothetical protein